MDVEEVIDVYDRYKTEKKKILDNGYIFSYEYEMRPPILNYLSKTAKKNMKTSILVI